MLQRLGEWLGGHLVQLHQPPAGVLVDDVPPGPEAVVEAPLIVPVKEVLSRLRIHEFYRLQDMAIRLLGGRPLEAMGGALQADLLQFNYQLGKRLGAQGLLNRTLTVQYFAMGRDSNKLALTFYSPLTGERLTPELVLSVPGVPSLSLTDTVAGC